MRIGGVSATAIALLATASAAMADESPRARVRMTMDAVFGPAKWRETGGYRTPERENELRAQGALTVPVGVLSRHSMGTPQNPGAYDLVVEGLSPQQAAARLRQAGAPFRTIFAEGAHGSQGAHLHIEPDSRGARATVGGPPRMLWTVTEPTPAERALARLHDAADTGRAEDQLRLGQVYAEGRLAPRDRLAAYVWTDRAAANGAADAATREAAQRLLGALASAMRPEELSGAQRFTNARSGDSACAADGEPAAIVVLIGMSSGPQVSGGGC